MSRVMVLREMIERSANELRQTSALAMLVKQGKITPRAIALYLESLRYLFSQSPEIIRAAAQRSDALGRTNLGDYFRNKLSEEQGHDNWATADLARLPASITAGVRPAHAIVQLVELQRAMIARDPMCYAAYGLWAEYLTALLGAEWLAALAAFGYSREQLSAVANHLDADREHAARGFEEIDGLWQAEPSTTVVFEGVEEAARLFRGFCDEICAEAQRAA
ncbi:MAG TPA: hypothetical protein VJV78_20355 [Polyangiales bacterium]|nr:hypothetical protein [Polyangiales bacterium]